MSEVPLEDKNGFPATVERRLPAVRGVTGWLPRHGQTQPYRGKKQRAPWDPTVEICLWPYGGPIGGGCFISARNPCTVERRRSAVRGVTGWLPRHSEDVRSPTGVPRSHETAPPQDPTVGLCLVPYGDPSGGGSYE